MVGEAPNYSMSKSDQDYPDNMCQSGLVNSESSGGLVGGGPPYVVMGRPVCWNVESMNE